MNRDGEGVMLVNKVHERVYLKVFNDAYTSTYSHTPPGSTALYLTIPTSTYHAGVVLVLRTVPSISDQSVGYSNIVPITRKNIKKREPYKTDGTQPNHDQVTGTRLCSEKALFIVTLPYIIHTPYTICMSVLHTYESTCM